MVDIAPSRPRSGRLKIAQRFRVDGGINIFSSLIGVAAVIMIMVGGFRYITSGGNDTAIAESKKTLVYAIIGLAIAALAQLIVKFVLTSVGS